MNEMSCFLPCRVADVVLAPHGAPRHAPAAGDVSREVREDIRWLEPVIEPWGGRESGLSAMAQGASLWFLTVFLWFARARDESNFGLSPILSFG